MSRDYKLNVVYVNKKGILCELEGRFTKEETFNDCMNKIKEEIETLKAFQLFKKKRIPQQLELDMV